MTDLSSKTVSVFGLGYVGCVSATCLAHLGHRVIGVDAHPVKMATLRRGLPLIVEDRMEELTAEVVESGLLTVSDDAASAVAAADLSLICVGTPSTATGDLSTFFLEQVTKQIGWALAVTDRWHTVEHRSAMLPGTCHREDYSGIGKAFRKKRRRGLRGSCESRIPREGTSVQDFFDPPKTVVGSTDPRSGEPVLALYKSISGTRYTVPIKVAEMTKYVGNSFHTLKLAFAKEIGAVCSAVDLDSHAVMEIFLTDAKLNLSGAYRKPGFAIGGSCLHKDLCALDHIAGRNAVDILLLGNLLRSNEHHLPRALSRVLGAGKRRVTLSRLSFKSGTDDLRESPMVELAELLIGKGFDVRIFVADVTYSFVVGANAPTSINACNTSVICLTKASTPHSSTRRC